jgi:transcriptional regulator with XRE-family HTH domain
VADRRDGLRRRRLEMGFSQEGLALALGVATSTYRSWEAGVHVPLVGFRAKLARALAVSLAEVSRWFDDDLRPGAPDGLAVPAWLGHLATLEQGAGQILTYQPIVVPGLLQTEAYATAVERAEPVSDEDALLRVKSRLARQAVLCREPDPLHLSVLLDESVLHRPAGDARTMAGQLHHLVTLSTSPTIEIRVIPLDAGLFSAAWGHFQVLTSPGSTEPYMACVIDAVGAHYLERPGDVEAHVRVFERLAAVALSAAESRDLFLAVAQERYR